MLENNFKWFQQEKILYLDYYEVSAYNKSNNMPDLSRYTDFKLLNEPMKATWINNETVNIRKGLIILKITFFFIAITASMSDGAVIFTTNISVHCKSYLLYLRLFVMNLILQEQILNFNNTIQVVGCHLALLECRHHLNVPNHKLTVTEELRCW